MITVAAAIAIALRLAPSWSAHVHTDEGEADYRARVSMIGETAWDVADMYADRPWVRLHYARGLLVLVRHESSYRLDVHSGAKLGDHGKAACLAQLHAVAAGGAEAWAAVVGTDKDATARCLGAALRVLRGAVGTCARQLGRRGTPLDVHAGGLALYGTGRATRCREPGAGFVRRAEEWLR